MKRKYCSWILCWTLILAFLPGLLPAQVKPADYERALNLREKFQSLVFNSVDRSGWIGKTARFWYRKSIEGGFEFYVVNAADVSKKIAFDHTRLAAALTDVLKEDIDPKDLPFRSIRFATNERSIQFDIGGWTYSCDLTSYSCEKGEPVRRRRRGGFTMWERGPAPEAESSETKKSPVIEYIYAGPHGSFVPKSFSAFNRMQSLAEMGFIVVQCDGMGTNNRSKAFHDVAWKNLGDAGFPDRILWHKAIAAKYPYYDIDRVGIYGNSAGGQNALGGLLFFPGGGHGMDGAYGQRKMIDFFVSNLQGLDPPNWNICVKKLD